jgi:hypothetical protein
VSSPRSPAIARSALGALGALLGAVLLLLWPLALLAVLLLARRGRYPAWLVTPDDPFVTAPPAERPLHFGHYEASVRAVYARLGRYWGDVYWLGIRNVLYGLRYALKPARFKGVQDYSVFGRSITVRGALTTYCVEGYVLWQWRVAGIELLAGWMVRGAALDPFTPRQPVNMEFRPVLSPRRAG